ncbi:MAG TPA: hypothetical protein VNT30_12700 [Stellaceae bacterium]|nr:hypothetical protein [Stellaceae bacterium]
MSETKSDIIVRALSATAPKIAAHIKEQFLDLGQGVRLKVGEIIYLFLSEDAKRRRQPDATAEVRADGLYMKDARVPPFKGSFIHPAMLAVQQKRNHRNEKDKIISLSAWRQWHAERGGKLMRLFDLKDPALAHKRGIPLIDQI